MLNLHSYFNRYHTIEFRCFNFDEESAERKGGLHAGQLKAMIQLCMAMSQMAKQLKTASPRKQQTENEAYAFRCWMLRLGFTSKATAPGGTQPEGSTGQGRTARRQPPPTETATERSFGGRRVSLRKGW